MTHSSDHRDEYTNQGQQDDYFEQDLAIAGHELQNRPQRSHDVDDYTNQGQQDDYFEQDLTTSSDRPQP